MRKKLFINGNWQEAKQYAPLYSPYSGEKLAEVPVADEEETNQAIEAAYQARPRMRELSAHARAAILQKVSSLFRERLEEAARIVAQEAAKPLKTARTEIMRTIQTYQFAAEEAKRIGGEVIPLDAAAGGEGRLAYTKREPIGVIGAITPFNFPMNLVAHKVGPAIASGNTVVLKPASQTPLSAFFLAEVMEEAGLPPGALNVVTGSGKTVGEQLVRDSRIAMITFTGSPPVGIGIKERAGLKRVTLELGSNSAAIIDQTVKDQLDWIAERCVTGAFTFQGQVCISLQRIYVHEALYDLFVEKFVAKTKALKWGDPLDEETDISALITPNDVSRTLAWIEEAVQDGAKLACGGEREGSILKPTVLLGVKEAHKVSCQEVFGPVVSINPVRSVEEGLALTNDSRYGLQAGIFTTDLNTALWAADHLEVGGVMINDIPTFRVDHMPYGGVKESGFGREGVRYAVEEMTELKLVVINRSF